MGLHSMSRLTDLWNFWDLRLMVLISLIIQFILLFLGRHRKYNVKIWLRMVLWLTYLTADSIATAALGNLSRAQGKTNLVNILRALWAPTLLLHLGGPDTITAYVLEDNELWTRHLLWLVLETLLVLYVLVMSWTRSWLSHVMNILMFLAGFIKYVERTWSLHLASSGQAKGTIPVFDMDTLVENPEKLSDEDKLVVAYQFFSAFRPDITNYISPRENLSSSGTKLILRFMNNVEMTGLWNINMDYLLHTLHKLKPDDLSNIVEVELEFMFDVLYTKVPLIYTKKGCIFRFISICCSVCVLVLFFAFFSVVNQPGNHYTIVDIIITCILLGGAIIVELYAILRLVSSDWTELWIKSRHRKDDFLCRTLRNFISWLSTIEKRKDYPRHRKRWSGLMGQFNLVSYCFKYKEEGKIFTDVQKKIHRHLHTKFKEVPDSLKKKDLNESISSSNKSAFIAPRGEKALQKYEDLKWSIELDFDESIITWHLVTDICYHIDEIRSTEDKKEVNVCCFGCFGEETEEEDVAEGGEKLEDTCQVISNYMMYLLVMQPDMILPGCRKDFWFSHVSETIGNFFEDKEKKSKKEEKQKGKNKIVNGYHVVQRMVSLSSKKEEQLKAYKWLGERKSSPGASEVERNAWKIVRQLEGKANKWEIIKDVWLEMMCYAAIACQHVNHARQLRRGGEYLTHLWLRLTMAFLKNS